MASLADAARCRIGGVGGTVATKVGDEEFIVIRGDTPIPVAQAGGASTVRWGVKVLKSLKNNGGLINVGVLPAGELPVTGKKLILRGGSSIAAQHSCSQKTLGASHMAPGGTRNPMSAAGLLCG